jgi:2-polyprenyl-3-methyl-5-hydroxy-6-metoxy-1,4-benzoquinol methylase
MTATICTYPMKTAAEKYLPKPFYGSSHVWAMKKLSTLPKEATVLDIGAGSGIVGMSLAEAGITNTYAVEPDSAAANECQKYYKEVQPSFERYQGRTFDAIVVLDVLEHIATPEIFFTEAAKLLKPGGTMIVSVPNLYHWSMRFLLLFGLLEYTDRGLFDKTHLQFFSQKRLSTLFACAGIKITERDVSISPAEFVLPEWFTKTIFFKCFSITRLFCARVWKNLGAYQFLVLGVKS